MAPLRNAYTVPLLVVTLAFLVYFGLTAIFPLPRLTGNSGPNYLVYLNILSFIIISIGLIAAIRARRKWEATQGK